MMTRDDIAIAHRFEPTDDGHFLHRQGRKDYKLTRAQAAPLARHLERAQTWFLLFSMFMVFLLLDFFFGLRGPLWLSVKGVVVLSALGAAIFSAVDQAKVSGLLSGCPSSEVDKTRGPAKPWRQRFASLRNPAGIRLLGTRNLILQGLVSFEWFVVSALVLWTSPAWIAEGSAWLAEVDGNWFAQGALYAFGAFMFFGLVFLVIFSPFVIAACLRTLQERSQATELEGTNGA